MRKIKLIPSVLAVWVAVCVCMTACCATQGAAKYVNDQENKNLLITSIGESVDALRSCLSPHSNFSQDEKKVSATDSQISAEDTQKTNSQEL